MLLGQWLLRDCRCVIAGNAKVELTMDGIPNVFKPPSKSATPKP